MQREPYLVHELPIAAAERAPTSAALRSDGAMLDYEQLVARTHGFAGALLALGIKRGERIGIFLDKNFEAVVAAFGACRAGAVFVPINPLLKPAQVHHILRDCDVRLLVSSPERLERLGPLLMGGGSPPHLVVVGDGAIDLPGLICRRWADLPHRPGPAAGPMIDSDVAAILYTSGSTGRPKGVVLSHRNLVSGAKSVVAYLGNGADDVLLAALPLSFDAGFSQLTTAFYAGATTVLLQHLLPRDIVQALAAHRITGFTAVAPLWIQLAQTRWPESIADHLRYFASTGGPMPARTLKALRERLPASKPYLMYGLTESFRSTYLPPDEVDRRPGSIGKAIPNAEILVLREDGSECGPGEPGELVHRGPLVAMGYWNDPVRTAERFRPLPPRVQGLVLPEIAVYSGDTVRKDEDGFLYFLSRRDEMIKTSGYRVSPSEIEEALHETGLVGEAVAFGVTHPVLGQAIVAVVTPGSDAGPDAAESLLSECRIRLPAYMVPAHIDFRKGPLPRGPNGKLDRRGLAEDFATLFDQES